MSHYTGAVPDTRRPADWRDTGACRGANNDAWFPHPTNAAEVRTAKDACFDCPVIFHCAQYALTRRIPDGVWGGLNEKQRNSITSQHRADTITDIGVVRAAVLHALHAELNPVRTLSDVWDDRTYPLPGGHIGWRGDSGSFSVKGHVYTPKRLAFLLDRGHKATGVVRRTCEVVECVHPQHLADSSERYQRQQAAAEAGAARKAAAGQARRRLAPCGTRSAYQRHVRNREPVDDECRAANTAAWGAYLRRASTKVAV